MAVLFFGCWLLNLQFLNDTFRYNYSVVLTNLAKIIFNILGMNVWTVENAISFKSFHMVIAPTCIALYEAVVFAAAVIAYPLKIRFRIAGVIVGIVAILATNFVRIIILFLTGIYFPFAFKLLHEQVGQILYTLCIIYFWILWIGTFSPKNEQKNVAPS